MCNTVRVTPKSHPKTSMGGDNPTSGIQVTFSPSNSKGGCCVQYQPIYTAERLDMHGTVEAKQNATILFPSDPGTMADDLVEWLYDDSDPTKILAWFADGGAIPVALNTLNVWRLEVARISR